jgi:CRISPR/Cas system-associated exonuclease Cas4 (RecB family)
MIVPKRSPLPLRRGSYLHSLLEAKYATGDWRPKQHELAKGFDSMFEEEREYYGDLPRVCEHIMESYDYWWRAEDEELNVIETEYEFEVELPHGHVLGGQADAIVEDEWGMWLMEHKSHKTLPDADYRFLDMQTARYVWALQKLGYPLTGVLWNYIVTVEPKRPKLTQKGVLSKAKCKTDLFTFVDTIQQYGLDPHDYRSDILRLKGRNEFFRRERVPKPKHVIETLVKEAVVVADEIERGVKPVRSIDRSCDWCSYLDICITSLYGGDSQSIVKARYQKATKKDYYGYEDVPTD